MQSKRPRKYTQRQNERSLNYARKTKPVSTSILVCESFLYQAGTFTGQPSNKELMFFTWDVSHFEISPLKEAASLNMERMSFTWDVSHFEISPLKENASL